MRIKLGTRNIFHHISLSRWIPRPNFLKIVIDSNTFLKSLKMRSRLILIIQKLFQIWFCLGWAQKSFPSNFLAISFNFEKLFSLDPQFFGIHFSDDLFCHFRQFKPPIYIFCYTYPSQKNIWLCIQNFVKSWGKLLWSVLRRAKFILVRYLCETHTQTMNAGVAFASVGFSVGLGLGQLEFQLWWQAKVGPG